MPHAPHRLPTPTTTLRAQPRTAAILCLFLLIAVPAAHAAPIWGSVWTLAQPDGTLVSVKIWGDEFYQVVESLDGYTLVRDPATQVICYATLSADSDDLVSTGIRLQDTAPPSLRAAKHLRIAGTAARSKAMAARERFRALSLGAARLNAATLNAATLNAAPTTGVVKGICLIVDFSDCAGTITSSLVSDFCNKAGYTGNGNKGSVRDYFYDVSDGHLTYTNTVSASYYRAKNNKTYYDNPADEVGLRARELVLEALAKLESTGFDFSKYDSNQDGVVDAVNVLYAGTCSSGWSKGLWPHSGDVSFSADGVAISGYQMTSMGTALTLGVFCHENGHMLCGWPDLYDYGYESAGVGVFCLMCSGSSGTNPSEPCAYLKIMSGWATVSTANGSHTAKAGVNSFFKYANLSAPKEYFLVEDRYKTARDSILPDSGIAIWHVDETGSNNNQQRTQASHYEVTLVQADGRWDMENNRNNGDATDLWKTPTYASCGPSTTPNTSWWSGQASGLQITVTSAAATSMNYTIGAFTSRTLTVKSSPLTGVSITGDVPGTTNYTGACSSDQVVNLTAPATALNTQGVRYRFVKWKLDLVAKTAGARLLQVAMTAAHTAEAVYELDTVTLTVQSTPASAVAITGTKPGTTNYTAVCTIGTAVSLTAPAAPTGAGVRYKFLQWKVDNVAKTVNQATVQVTMNANHTAVAVYTVETYPLYVRSTPISGISIIGDKAGVTHYAAFCPPLQLIRLTAPPTATSAQGVRHEFVRWIVDSVNQPVGQAGVLVSMTAVRILVAVYEIQDHTLTVKSTSITGASITGTTPGTTDFAATCADGQAVGLTAPAGVTVSGVGFDFVRWNIDGAGQPLRDRTAEITMGADHTATCEWRLAGDVNGDCKVSILDLISIRFALGQPVSDGSNWTADVDGDGKINILDMIYVRSRLGRTCP